MTNKNYYKAEIRRINSDGSITERCWGFLVNPDFDCFTIRKANEILEKATEEFRNRFGEEIDFNFVSLEMGDRKGKYWRDSNHLIIDRDGMPVYENNDGIICKDAAALADSLM